jgi:hypothetical protein
MPAAYAHPVARWIVAGVAALWIAWIAIGWAVDEVSGNDRADRGGDHAMAEIEASLRDTWESDLRDKQRKRGLDGELWVVGVDCAKRPDSHFACLAHVAATGEARRVAPRPVVITGRRGSGGGWVARERE